MKKFASACCLLLLSGFFYPTEVLSQDTQDNITIPKSRLEELERKEKELERLKLSPAPAPSPTPSMAKPEAQASPPIRIASPAPKPSAPPIDTLPPFKEAELLTATDLATYYRENPKTANERFKNRKITVRGEIAGFEKPMMRRNYYLLLETGDRDTKVVCDLLPPDRFSSVFTINHGSQLVGLQGETRVAIAKVGQKVMIKGKCKGFSDGAVTITGIEFRPLESSR